MIHLPPAYYIPVFLAGLILGSFFNVLIYRIPRQISFSKGYSKCQSCGHRLMPQDLVPLFSWLFLKGRCRYCKEPISCQYPVVELLTGTLYVAVAWQFGFTPQALVWCVVCSCLLVVAFIDWQHMIIPDTLNIIIAAMGVILVVLQPQSWLNRLLGGFSVSVLFLLIVLVSKGKAMGGGDIKLMAALGLCLGWQLNLFTMAIGAVLGTLVMLILRPTRYALGREVPFGSFLAVAGIWAILWGPAFLSWYLALLMPKHVHIH